jgi:uncharacterized protein (DUF1800 family)
MQERLVRAARGGRVVARLAAIVLGVIALAAMAAAAAQEASPVFRFYNNRTGTHFYTISSAERDTVLNNYPWFAYEGAVYWAYTGSQPGLLPVYRFYNTSTGTHFYTQSESEKNYVLATYPVFAFEGPAYYAPPDGAAQGSTPLYRFYNSRTGAHFYTISADERDKVLDNWPWFAYESVAYYVYSTPPVNTPPSTNAVPKATLTVSSTTVSVPGTVTLSVNATDDDGSVAKVQFFEGTTLLGEAIAPPYTLDVPLNTAGMATFIALAIDDKGATGASNAVGVMASSGSGTPGNAAPKVSLAADRTSFAAPGSATLTATASDTDGTIASVRFYAGATLVGSVSSAPYTYTYTTPVAGTVNFTAVALDNGGATATSNTVTLIASNGGGTPGNSAPKVSLAANQTTFVAPGSATLTATASDTDGAIASVKFYNGTTLLRTVTAPPYTYAYSSASPATASFTAVAQDDSGATATSNAVTITATAAPGGGGAAVPKLGFTVSSTLLQAPSTVVLTANNVSSPGGAIARVSFYMNGTKLADKTATPYTFTTAALSAGTYTFTAEAADVAGGTHMTLPVNVTVTGPPASGPVPQDVWRLLQQATFGPTYAEAQRVQAMGISGWIDDQFNQPVSGYPDAKYNRIQLGSSADCTTQDPNKVAYPADHPYSMCVRDHLSLAMLQRDFFTNAVYKPDQLRQRVAWALSQILVTSANEPDLSYAHVMSRYQGLMFKHAFGNFESLLNDVTLSPAMGNYLDQVNNDRASGTRVPNENYAREIMQLFSVGLEELNLDGTVITDVNGMPLPTYDQTQIKEFAKVFTGLTYADPANPAATTAAKKNNRYYALPMIPYPVTATSGHEQGAKTLLVVDASGQPTVLPANQSVQKDQADAVHNVFMHPNTPVYVGRQLIQRLVTGNPSKAYILRIAQRFIDNGAGVRGDLRAVVKAILTDPEARGGGSAGDPTYGSLKEPVLMITGLIRSLSGVTDGNRLEGAASGLGQRPYYSPTVFNYFPPDNTIQGTTTLAPEFLIHNTQSAIARSNLVYSMVYNPFGVDNTIANSTGTRLNVAQFEANAGNPAQMVDQVDQVLTGGQMPAAAKATVVTAVNAVAATNPTARAQMAVYLIASSYHYQVQR